MPLSVPRALDRRTLITALAGSAVLSACQTPRRGVPAEQERVEGMARIEGAVVLPPGALLQVSLVDVSRADARAPTLAQTRLPLSGPGPWPFDLSVERRLIDPRGSYSVRAEIGLEGGQPAYVTDTAHLVLGHSGQRQAQLLLRPVDNRARAAATRIEGRRWVLVSLDGQPLDRQDPASAPFFTLHPEDQRVSGSGGCNPLHGRYRLNGAALQLLRDPPSESRSCPTGMERERALRFALVTTEQWRLDGRRLRLYDRLGAQVAVFEDPATP